MLAALGQATEAGAHLLTLSGSVSTTPEQRSIASASALARHWHLPYKPHLRPAEPAPLPVLDAVFPLILTLSLLHALATASLDVPYLASASRQCGIALFYASRIAPPLAMAAVAARRTAQLGESGMIAGVLAGAITCGGEATGFAGANQDGGCTVAALAAGIAAGFAARRALGVAHAIALPATASTLFCVGGAGLCGGVLGAFIGPLSASATSLARTFISALVSECLPVAIRALLGGMLGVLTKRGSVLGYYHSVMFPLIIVEMELGGLALLGAFDACCLCCVCAGICAATSLTSANSAPAEASACRQAMRINLLLGDYVEACYPYMAKSASVNVGAYLGAAIAGATLLIGGGTPAPPRSSAYLPIPLAIALSERPAHVAVAAILAFAVPFSSVCFTARAREGGRRS